MKNFKVPICFVLIVSLMTFLLTSCGTTTKQNKNIVLNEVVRSIFYAPQYVAIEKGFFEEYGLDITLETAWGADKSMIALISGNADIGLIGPEASVYVYNEGKENYAVNFAQLTQKAGNFLIGHEAKDNFTWTDVEGMTIIGGRKGGMPEMVLEYILKQNNIIPYEDVEIINNINYTATAGSFVSGIGDFTAEFEPTASTLENENKGCVVASLGTSSGDVPYTSYMATKEYIEKNEDIILNFTKAVYKSQTWVDSHEPEEIAKVISPFFEGTNLDLLTQIVKRYKDQDTWCKTPIFKEESLDLLQRILKSAGELDKEVPYEDLVITEYAGKVIGE